MAEKNIQGRWRHRAVRLRVEEIEKLISAPGGRLFRIVSDAGASTPNPLHP